MSSSSVKNVENALSLHLFYNAFQLSTLWQYQYSQGCYITISCDLRKGQSLSNIGDIFLAALMGHVLYLKSHSRLFPLWGPGKALFKMLWTRRRYGTRYLRGEKKCQGWKGFRGWVLKIVLPFFVKAYWGWTPCVTHISLKGNEKKKQRKKGQSV